MRRVVVAGVAAGLVAVLAYLRDPPWLLDITSGLSRWETSTEGVRFRSMAGHASFFVPATATSVVIPLRVRFDTPQEWPVTARITIDDRPANQIVLRDGTWHRVVLSLPPAARRRSTRLGAALNLSRERRARRIDVRVDRLRAGGQGAQVGEIEIHAASPGG